MPQQNPMKKNYLPIQICRLLLAVIITSCSGNEQSNSKEKNMEHKEHQHENHSHSGHEFTDKHTVEELAKKFESPERDSMQQPQKIVQYLGDIKGKTLMDIGAGTGYFSVRFADKGANVIAVDVSDEFQNYLKQRIEKNNIKNIELRKTPYDSPLLKNGEADIVFIANTYHHIENRTDYFSKVKNGLKTTGELIVVDYFKADLPKEVTAPPMEIRTPVDQVVFELKKAGFTFFEIEVNMLRYHYIIKAK
ncbi:MAG: class SAM-dependent methyltransferase [Bacteroidetes bacterium]|jgi:cyclopropane fatty-acyl-phospholipid synthase-like methyltransferase|nr:class SAM-dependent methyltransferase [Bacteroidota bacterium]